MPRRVSDLVIVAAATLAMAASVVTYLDERNARQPVEDAISKFELDARRPADVEVLRFQPAVDLRASFFSHMTLTDVYSPVSMARLSAEEKGRWLRSLTTLDAQLAAARDLTLDALARRPGWAFHHAFVGQVEYAALRRKSIRAAAAGSRRWEVAMLHGIAAAPGYVSFPAYLAGAYLETWGGMEYEGDPVEVMKHAMTSPGFVSRNYRLVGLALGRDEAMALLPDDPRILRIAYAREARDTDVRAAAALRARIDGVERLARARDLEYVRERARLGDVLGLRSAVVTWAASYRPEEIDDATGRAEVGEILAFWPATRRGSWLGDPRAALVRYFLSGREDYVDGATLEAALEVLEDVPEPVIAQVKALAGRTWEANQMLRRSGTRGSFEWTPVVVELSRAYLAEGKREEARSVLATASESAAGECNVVLLRHALEERGASDRQLPSIAPTASTATGIVSLCIDRSRDGDAIVSLSLSSTTPSLVSWGWDGGRIGSLLVDGEAELDVPLSGMSGRHSLRVESEVGPKVELVDVRIVRP